MWLHNGVRYVSAFLVLVVLYALLYGWLPDMRQRLYTVVPDAVVGAALWIAAAAALSYTLRTAGKLALFYGSFAGAIATLVFLYISATALIFGAEINGVLREKSAGGKAHRAVSKNQVARSAARSGGGSQPEFAAELLKLAHEHLAVLRPHPEEDFLAGA